MHPKKATLPEFVIYLVVDPVRTINIITLELCALESVKTILIYPGSQSSSPTVAGKIHSLGPNSDDFCWTDNHDCLRVHKSGLRSREYDNDKIHPRLRERVGTATLGSTSVGDVLHTSCLMPVRPVRVGGHLVGSLANHRLPCLEICYFIFAWIMLLGLRAGCQLHEYVLWPHRDRGRMLSNVYLVSLTLSAWHR